jgi:hypothetical protein
MLFVVCNDKHKIEPVEKIVLEGKYLDGGQSRFNHGLR